MSGTLPIRQQLTAWPVQREHKQSPQGGAGPSCVCWCRLGVYARAPAHFRYDSSMGGPLGPNHTHRGPPWLTLSSIGIGKHWLLRRQPCSPMQQCDAAVAGLVSCLLYLPDTWVGCSDDVCSAISLPGTEGQANPPVSLPCCGAGTYLGAEDDVTDEKVVSAILMSVHK